jgi:lipid A 4'-phosphatase
LTAALFLTWPEIDMAVEHLFADGVSGFPLRHHPVAKWFNTLINNLAAILILFTLLGLILTSRMHAPFAGLWRRQHGFVFSAIVLGPGVIANFVFKEHWGRARPRQIAEFGGAQDFSPPLVMTDQCATNCSFVSGDASMAFAMLARGAAVLALVFGLFIGLVRMVQGAHFLSDVLFAGYFVVGTILILKYFMLDGWHAPAHQPWLRATLFPKQGDQTVQSGAQMGSKPPADKGRFWLFFGSKPQDFGL